MKNESYTNFYKVQDSSVYAGEEVKSKLSAFREVNMTYHHYQYLYTLETSSLNLINIKEYQGTPEYDAEVKKEFDELKEKGKDPLTSEEIKRLEETGFMPISNKEVFSLHSGREELKYIAFRYGFENINKNKSNLFRKKSEVFSITGSEVKERYCVVGLKGLEFFSSFEELFYYLADKKS